MVFEDSLSQNSLYGRGVELKVIDNVNGAVKRYRGVMQRKESLSSEGQLSRPLFIGSRRVGDILEDHRGKVTIEIKEHYDRVASKSFQDVQADEKRRAVVEGELKRQRWEEMEDELRSVKPVSF